MVLKGDPKSVWPNLKPKAYAELTDEERRKLRRRQTLIAVWLVFVGWAFAGVWYFPTAFVPFIAKSFMLTTPEIGLLISSFAITYALFNLVWGNVTDLYWPHRTLTAGFIAAGVLTILFPFATTFGASLALRLLTGIANAVSWPGILKLVALWFPVERRGRYMGLFIGVYSLAISLNFLIGIPVALTVGWPVWTYFLGAMSLASGVAAYWIARPYGPLVGLPLIDWGDVSPSKNISYLTAVKTLFRYRWLVLTALGAFIAPGTASVVASFWVSQLVPQLDHISVSTASFLGTAAGLSQVVFVFLGGFLTDRTLKRVLITKVGAGLAFFSMLAVVATTVFHPLPFIVLLLVSIFTGGVFILGGSVFPLLADVYGTDIVGTALSYFEALGAGLGTFVMPLTLGFTLGPLGPTYSWLIISLYTLLVFALWLPQREFKAIKSMVSPEELKQEEERRKRELGLE
ncbi:putative transporter YybO [Sulfodiicoccus acidiphilus]|uniref:Putative transporter YybO n=1 Tax=Sulfodiicoccus acidiphilus TaxID=1670455 RepID=A0A348B1K2_9CREN|nr:MFS transporter [Sulfodiicoccus acidiphilus]BBD72054.1 putative transporter YybO [Sulfodiicoccus acidiphilus]GGU00110.1 putative transporter YybO [Sulfodiicoccus acidiphilus]